MKGLIRADRILTLLSAELLCLNRGLRISRNSGRAKMQATNLYYDQLNRLKGKTYTSRSMAQNNSLWGIMIRVYNTVWGAGYHGDILRNEDALTAMHNTFYPE